MKTARRYDIAPPSATPEEALQRFTSARDYRYLLGVYDERTKKRLLRLVEVIDRCRQIDDELDLEIWRRFGIDAERYVLAQSDYFLSDLLAYAAPSIYSLEVTEKRRITDQRVEFVLGRKPREYVCTAVKQGPSWHIVPPWKLDPTVGLELYQRYLTVKQTVLEQLRSNKFHSHAEVIDALIALKIGDDATPETPQSVIERYEALSWFLGRPEAERTLLAAEAVRYLIEKRGCDRRRFSTFQDLQRELERRFGPSRRSKSRADASSLTALGLVDYIVDESTTAATDPAVEVPVGLLRIETTLLPFRHRPETWHLKRTDQGWRVDNRPAGATAAQMARARQEAIKMAELFERLANELRNGQYRSREEVARLIQRELRQSAP